MQLKQSKLSRFEGTSLDQARDQEPGTGDPYQYYGTATVAIAVAATEMNSSSLSGRSSCQCITGIKQKGPSE